VYVVWVCGVGIWCGYVVWVCGVGSVGPAGGGAEEGDTRPSVDRSASCVSGNASLRTGSVSRVGSSAVGKEAAVPLAHEQMSQDDLRNKILRGAVHTHTHTHTHNAHTQATARYSLSYSLQGEPCRVRT